MKFPFKDRPVCSCGVKMKLMKYEGYYDEFFYWQCDNCNIENRMHKYDQDQEEKGSYA